LTLNACTPFDINIIIVHSRALTTLNLQTKFETSGFTSSKDMMEPQKNKIMGYVTLIAFGLNLGI